MSLMPTPDDISRCLADYSCVGATDAVTPMEGSFHNTLYHVVGAGGEFYLKVLTTHHAQSTEERYQYLQSVMECADAGGIRVPLNIRGDRGRILTHCGGFSAALSAAVHGDELDFTGAERHAAAGALLARLHQATANLHPRGDAWLRDLGGYLLLDAAIGGRLPEPLGCAFREYLPDLMARSQRMRDRLQTCGYAHLPRVVIHGDCVPKHFVMAGDDAVGLLDFEYTRSHARAVDVALALRYLSWIGAGIADSPLGLARAFVRGYNSSGWPLRDDELAAIPVLAQAWELECVTFWYHELLSGRDIGEFGRRERIETILGQSDWWRDHASEVIEALTGA